MSASILQRIGISHLHGHKFSRCSYYQTLFRRAPSLQLIRKSIQNQTIEGIIDDGHKAFG